jgi:hypothetical protein
MAANFIFAVSRSFCVRFRHLNTFWKPLVAIAFGQKLSKNAFYKIAVFFKWRPSIFKLKIGSQFQRSFQNRAWLENPLNATGFIAKNPKK